MHRFISSAFLFVILAGTGCSSPADPGLTPDAQADAAPDASADSSGDVVNKPDANDGGPAFEAGDADADVADVDAAPQGTPCNSDMNCGATEACPGLAWLEGANQVCTSADGMGGASCAAAPSAVVVDGSKVVYLDYAFDSSSTRTDNVSCGTNPPSSYVEQVFTVDITKGGTYEIWSNDDGIAVFEGSQCPGTCNDYVGPQVTTGGSLGAQTIHIIVFHNPNNAPRGHVEIIPQ